MVTFSEAIYQERVAFLSGGGGGGGAQDVDNAPLVWFKRLEPTSGQPFYECLDTQTTQWEKPTTGTVNTLIAHSPNYPSIPNSPDSVCMYVCVCLSVCMSVSLSFLFVGVYVYMYSYLSTSINEIQTDNTNNTFTHISSYIYIYIHI